jgi:hypothetical protein
MKWVCLHFVYKEIMFTITLKLVNMKRHFGDMGLSECVRDFSLCI